VGVPATVQTYIDGKRPIGAIPTVFAADELAVAIDVTAYVDAAYNTAATQTAIQTAIEDYIDSLPIGGTLLPTSPNGIVSLDRMRRAVLDVEGVVDVTFNAPFDDVALLATQVAAVSGGTPTVALTSV